MKTAATLLLTLSSLVLGGDVSAAPAPLLLQHPTLSRDAIAFDFAGEIWTVAREGGTARRLVAGQGRNSGPLFSPDGSLVAYTGTYDENADVYVAPAAGGQPTRLTYHPGLDIPVGWTPDGKSVLFFSTRKTYRDLTQLYTVPATGGPATEIPLPSGESASFSADASQLAYVPHSQWQPAWKHYRGGQTTPIWIANLRDSSVTKIPRDGSNDKNPMWVGDTVYFLSDRSGPVTLFAYDTRSRAVRQVLANEGGFDIQSASAGPGGIVLDHFGALEVHDFASGQTRRVDVRIGADLPQLRPRFEKVEPAQILHAALSPTGKRVLIEARGEILAVPGGEGRRPQPDAHARRVADRDPAWSPDGKWIAYFSDESGEYALHLRAPDGLGPVRKIDARAAAVVLLRAALVARQQEDRLRRQAHEPLGGRSRQAGAGEDRHRPLRHALPVPRPRLVAGQPLDRLHEAAAQLPARDLRVFAGGEEDAPGHRRPQRRRPRRASTAAGSTCTSSPPPSAGLSQGWLDMTSMARPVTSSVYAAVLTADLPSPVAPESDEEGDEDDRTRPTRRRPEPPTEPAAAKPGDKAADKKAEEKPPAPVRIDFQGIDQRIVALPIERANYTVLETGAEGILFLLTSPVVLSDEDYAELDSVPPQNVFRFDLKKRKTEKLLEKIDGNNPVFGGLRTFVLSADGTKMLYAQGKKWSVAPSEKAPAAGDDTALKAVDRSARRSARRVEADVSRGLAPRARLPLRAELPRPRPQGGGARLRAVRGGDRQPRGPEHAVQGDDGLPDRRAHLHPGRRRSPSRRRSASACSAPTTGWRPDAISSRAILRRRELEPQAPGAR